MPAALVAVHKGGRVVCGGIHMSDIPAMPYAILWEERELVSVANLTRQDAVEFFPVAKAAGVRTHTTACGDPHRRCSIGRFQQFEILYEAPTQSPDGTLWPLVSVQRTSRFGRRTRLR